MQMRYRSSVSRLRDGLGGDAAAIVTRPPGYVLDVPARAVDAAQFEEACAVAGRALEAGDASAALASVEGALALWRGTPLAEFQYEDFASTEIARLEELRMVALECRADALLALGRSGALVPDLEALVRAHPHRERIWGQLMLALYRSGRQADALAAYREARTSLEETLGIDPSPALRRLETAILQQDAGLESPPASIVAPLRAARVPVPATELVGRDIEINAIASRLASPEVRLLTLTGTGGVGKTRLALEVASRMQESLRDGAAFVPLAPIDDPALAAPAIAAAIGGVSDDASPETALLEAIAGRELLLVLDNCEHLLGVAPLVAAMLARAPGLTTLATSRFALRIAGEHEQADRPARRASGRRRARGAVVHLARPCR